MSDFDCVSFPSAMFLRTFTRPVAFVVMLPPFCSAPPSALLIALPAADAQLTAFA